MKIEKVNDNQIRCTLTKEDLDSRKIKLSELAYGSDKAKGLFRDMMQQANTEFGFETNDIPLMVEAVPLSGGNIILMITKVDYPEELDTRFSKFSETGEEGDVDYEDKFSATVQGVDDILDMFKKMHKEVANDINDAKKDKDIVQVDTDIIEANSFDKKKADIDSIIDNIIKNTKASEKNEVEDDDIDINLAEDFKAADILVDVVKMFEFDSLEAVVRLSKVVKDVYHGSSFLYKNKQDKHFHLIVHKNSHTPEEFNRICNTIAEYSRIETYTQAVDAFYKEHQKCISEGDAIETLAEL